MDEKNIEVKIANGRLTIKGEKQEEKEGERQDEYGWVRGAGSAAFVAGALVAGQVASAWGLASVLLLTAVGLFGNRYQLRRRCPTHLRFRGPGLRGTTNPEVSATTELCPGILPNRRLWTLSPRLATLRNQQNNFVRGRGSRNVSNRLWGEAHAYRLLKSAKFTDIAPLNVGRQHPGGDVMAKKDGRAL